MAEYRDYLGDKLRLVEQARENEYFRKLDQELIAKMRQEAAATAEKAEEASPRDTNLFTPILVPVDFSPYAIQALERAADVAERFGSSLILLHVTTAQAGVQAVAQHLGASAVVPETPEGAENQPEVSDKEVETVCSYCGVGCNPELHTQDDTIVKVTSPADHSVTSGMLCIKGRFGWQYVQPLDPPTRKA